MCRPVNARAVPVVGVCLLSGIVQGCLCTWKSSGQRAERPDTTAIGGTSELVPVSMWPGEERRVTLPGVVAPPRAARMFELRGKGLAFTLHETSRVFMPRLMGVLPMNGAPGTGVNIRVRVDSLAVPGDTLSVIYQVFAPPRGPLPVLPRRSTWRVRVFVDERPHAEASTSLAFSGPPVVVKSVPDAAGVEATPNPFNPTTTLRYGVPVRGRVTLAIYDPRGACVVRLVDEVVEVGDHRVTWDGHDRHGRRLGSGVYFARLTTEAGSSTGKLLLLK